MSFSKPYRPHKPRFKDWLLYILDNDLSEDAKWHDRLRRTATIRWPHKSRGTWRLEKDARLFKMWAITSGKYRGGIDEPNPKSWKCNFRMNLNICKNIVELKDERIAKGPNACRVFKFLDRRTTQSCFYARTERSASFIGQQRQFYTAAIQEIPENYQHADISHHRIQDSCSDEIPPQVVDEYCNLPHPPLGLETPLTGFQPVEQDHPLHLEHLQTSCETSITSFEPVEQAHPFNCQLSQTDSESSLTSLESVEQDRSPLALPIDSYEASELRKMANSLVAPITSFCQAHM